MKRICICIVVISIIILGATLFQRTSLKSLNGKWYKYDSEKMKIDEIVNNNILKDEYIQIEDIILKEVKANGKDGVGSIKIRGNRLYSGDAIYKYDIDEVKDFKVLTLEVIGFDNGHSKEYFKSSSKEIYVMEKK